MKRYLSFAAGCTLLLFVIVAAPPLGATPAADLTIYADALAAGWEDWSWDTGVNLNNPAPVQSGVASASVTFQAAWAGFSLRVSPPLSTVAYSHLSFWIYGNGGALSLYTQASDGGTASPAYTFTPADNVWSNINVPLAAFGSPSAIVRITLQEDSGAAQPPLYLDTMRLTGGTAGPVPFTDFLADRVLGQPDFDSNSSGSTLYEFNWPSGAAVGPDGKLFIVDFQNNRVIRYPDARNFAGVPDLVITTSDGTTPLNGPESVAVDRNGTVYIAETLGHRVLVYSPDQFIASTILGQYGEDCPFGFVTFNFPRGVAVDGTGRLFVADQFHHRVLIFDPPLFTGMAASGVIGQSAMTACEANGGSTNSVNQSGLWGPRGVAIDTGGDLYVADSENNRVLKFAAPLTNGEPAVVVVGQQTFSSGNAGSTLSQMHFPIDLAIDDAGTLYVSDMFNNRVLGFLAGFANGQDADLSFGESRVTGSDCYQNFPVVPVSRSLFYCPQGLALDTEGSLYLADALHHRVLAFDRPVLNEVLFLPMLRK